MNRQSAKELTVGDWVELVEGKWTGHPVKITRGPNIEPMHTSGTVWFWAKFVGVPGIDDGEYIIEHTDIFGKWEEKPEFPVYYDAQGREHAEF